MPVEAATRTDASTVPGDGGRVVARVGAQHLLDTLLDEGGFVSWDIPIDDAACDEPYRRELAAAREKSGVDEAVITGEGVVDGHRVALIVGEFAFLGGSIGVAASDRIVRAVERATRERLPLVAAPVSGGTRMQEGTRAFVRMLTISAAVAAHKSSGLPYLVYLRNPTMGGVFASWGSMGHVTVAEPGALIGFLGPRVHRALTGEDPEPGVQTAEHLHRHGIIDAVVPAHKLARLLASALTILAPVASGADAAPAVVPPAPAVKAAHDPAFEDWDCVIASRSPERPGLRQLLHRISGLTLPLSGSGAGEADPGILVALARLPNRPVVIIGHDRRMHGSGGIGPEALRVAQRGIQLARELRLPIVTVIDTPGAALSARAEEGGLSGEIGRTIVALLEADVPTVAVILGQGVGGAALALLACDHVIATRAGWLSPLPPEGASAIVYRDTDHAADLARRQRVGSLHLLEDGVVHTVVDEDPADPDALLAALGDAIEDALAVAVG